MPNPWRLGHLFKPFPFPPNMAQLFKRTMKKWQPHITTKNIVTITGYGVVGLLLGLSIKHTYDAYLEVCRQDKEEEEDRLSTFARQEAYRLEHQARKDREAAEFLERVEKAKNVNQDIIGRVGALKVAQVAKVENSLLLASQDIVESAKVILARISSIRARRNWHKLHVRFMAQWRLYKLAPKLQEIRIERKELAKYNWQVLKFKVIAWIWSRRFNTKRARRFRKTLGKQPERRQDPVVVASQVEPPKESPIPPEVKALGKTVIAEGKDAIRPTSGKTLQEGRMKSGAPLKDVHRSNRPWFADSFFSGCFLSEDLLPVAFPQQTIDPTFTPGTIMRLPDDEHMPRYLIKTEKGLVPTSFALRTVIREDSPLGGPEGSLGVTVHFLHPSISVGPCVNAISNYTPKTQIVNGRKITWLPISKFHNPAFTIIEIIPMFKASTECKLPWNREDGKYEIVRQKQHASRLSSHEEIFMIPRRAWGNWNGGVLLCFSDNFKLSKGEQLKVLNPLAAAIQALKPIQPIVVASATSIPEKKAPVKQAKSKVVKPKLSTRHEEALKAISSGSKEQTPEQKAKYDLSVFDDKSVEPLPVTGEDPQRHAKELKRMIDEGKFEIFPDVTKGELAEPDLLATPEQAYASPQDDGLNELYALDFNLGEASAPELVRDYELPDLPSRDLEGLSQENALDDWFTSSGDDVPSHLPSLPTFPEIKTYPPKPSKPQPKMTETEKIDKATRMRFLIASEDRESSKPGVVADAKEEIRVLNRKRKLVGLGELVWKRVSAPRSDLDFATGSGMKGGL